MNAHRHIAAAGLLLLLALRGMAAETPPGVQSLESVAAAAEAAVRARWGGDGVRVQARADPLDARIRLAACGDALAVSVPFSGRAGHRVTAEVRCPGPETWKLYVPVRLAVMQGVVVAARALPRDGILTADDIELAERDTGTLPYGFMVDPANAAGHRLKRALSPGEALTPSHLAAPTLIRRGQRVTLEARSERFTVRMAGVALADGIRGEVIPVENLRSKREVEAIVRSEKSVEVLLR